LVKAAADSDAFFLRRGVPEPFGFREPLVDREELKDFFDFGFRGAGEVSFLERLRKLADEEKGFDIAILLQLTRLVKNQ
jgi:radical SAM superfamily enzyme YgiQ (UPF0313 family)